MFLIKFSLVIQLILRVIVASRATLLGEKNIITSVIRNLHSVLLQQSKMVLFYVKKNVDKCNSTRRVARSFS